MTIVQDPSMWSIKFRSTNDVLNDDLRRATPLWWMGCRKNPPKSLPSNHILADLDTQDLSRDKKRELGATGAINTKYIKISCQLFFLGILSTQKLSIFLGSAIDFKMDPIYPIQIHHLTNRNPHLSSFAHTRTSSQWQSQWLHLTW